MAGGYTLYRPDEDSSYMNKTEMIERIISLMGGRVAEKIIGGDISTGPSSDISRATDMARSMVTRYGMSEKLGPVVYGKDNDQVFLGMDYNHTKNYSDSYATAIDDEIKRIVIECEDRCFKILQEHNDKLVLIGETLIKDEKINKDMFLKLMDENYTPEDEQIEENTVPEGENTAEIVNEQNETLDQEEPKISVEDSND
jgi:cell division protease FtsH